MSLYVIPVFAALIVIYPKKTTFQKNIKINLKSNKPKKKKNNETQKYNIKIMYISILHSVTLSCSVYGILFGFYLYILQTRSP